jgi:AAA15 family ATPase/GTPase
MLVNFSVKNYKSFSQEVNLSMVASSLKETYALPAQAFTIVANELKILPVAAIYGANASGKSNLLDAMTMMKFHIQTSLAKDNVLDKIQVEPFRLSTETENGPTEFEISFIIKQKLFRYGFLATKERILEEWLYEKELKERAKEKELFYRDEGTLHHHPALFKVGKLINDQHLAKESVLILTLGYQLNEETAGIVMQWFTNFNTLLGHQYDGYQLFSLTQIKEQTDISNDMLDLIRFADTGIHELSTAVIFNNPEVLAHHTIFNEKNEPAGEKMFILDKQESEGTKKFFNLSGHILNSLKYGKVLVIDELDAQLHPNLMEKLVFMFQDKRINTQSAQLIFAGHNTNLLGSKLLRRDQVWVTEKNRYGATELYAIADYKTSKGKARNKEAMEQNYIDGKYGGVPFLGNLENFLEHFPNEQEATK